jgi:hypothetical protein
MHDRGNFRSRDGFGHVIIKKSNSFSVSDTLVQKMSGHLSICPEFGPFVKSLDIFGHIYNVRSVRIFMDKKAPNIRT